MYVYLRVHCVCVCVCVCVSVSVSVSVCVGVYYVYMPIRASTFVGVDCVLFCVQAFWVASAFNANIGAWNTASLTCMISVCAAFGRRRAMRRTRSVGVRWLHMNIYIDIDMHRYIFR